MSFPKKWARSEWRFPVTVYLCARIAGSLAGAIGWGMIPDRMNEGAKGASSLFELLGFTIWDRADASWYLRLAREGYSAQGSDAAFMPMFPGLIRLLHEVTRLPYLYSGLLISNAALLLSLKWIHELTRLEFGDEATSRRATWYLALFPGAVFCLAPYTEPLFTMLALGALLAARQGRWWLAALAGCALGVTRNTGVAILAPLAIEGWRARAGLKNWLKLAVVPLGLLAWMGFWARVSGDPILFIHKQSDWGREQSMPWSTLGSATEQTLQYSGSYPGGLYLFEYLAVGLVFALGIDALQDRLRRLRSKASPIQTASLSWSLQSWLWCLLLPPLLAPYPGNALMSCLRFVSVIFPVFIWLAARAKNEAFDSGIRATFAALYGLAAALFVSNQYMF
jgi:hypothetical protein